MSTTLAREVIQARKAHDLILEFHPIGKYEPNARNTIFHALSDLVIEHLGSIISLVEKRQHTGSALALLRPLIETYFRAAWVLNTASTEQIDQISKDTKDFPKFSQCKASAREFFAKGRVQGLYEMSLAFINNLHGFTHSGVEQVICRIGTDLEITPYAYPDDLIIKLLDTSTRFAVQSATLTIQHLEGSQDQIAQRVNELVERFLRLK